MQTHQVSFSRRSFLGGVAALGAASLVPAKLFGAETKPDSKFGGVQIGVITYSYRSMPGRAEEVLVVLIRKNFKTG